MLETLLAGNIRPYIYDIIFQLPSGSMITSPKYGFEWKSSLNICPSTGQTLSGSVNQEKNLITVIEIPRNNIYYIPKKEIICH